MKNKNQYNQEETRKKHYEKYWKVSLEKENIFQCQFFIAKVCLIHDIKVFMKRLIWMALECITMLDCIMHFNALDEFTIALEKVLTDIELNEIFW